MEKTESGGHIDVLEKPEDAETLSKDQLAYYARVTRGSRPKVPALRYKKPSKLPAVEVAKPGASYKPTFEVNRKPWKLSLFRSFCYTIGQPIVLSPE